MNVGDLVTARVIDVRPLLVRIVAEDQSGVIRGSAAGEVSVGQRIKVRITESNVGGRFEATLVRAG
jgi:hypothetical protein